MEIVLEPLRFLSLDLSLEIYQGQIFVLISLQSLHVSLLDDLMGAILEASRLHLVIKFVWVLQLSFERQLANNRPLLFEIGRSFLVIFLLLQ